MFSYDITVIDITTGHIESQINGVSASDVVSELHRIGINKDGSPRKNQEYRVAYIRPLFLQGDTYNQLAHELRYWQCEEDTMDYGVELGYYLRMVTIGPEIKAIYGTTKPMLKRNYPDKSVTTPICSPNADEMMTALHIRNMMFKAFTEYEERKVV